MNLRVATYNIRNGLAFDWFRSWPLRRRTVANVIRGLDADVIGLQEVHGFQQRYLQRKFADYTFNGKGRRTKDRGEACPLVVRHSFGSAQHLWTRWFGPDGQPGSKWPQASHPRIATSVALTSNKGVDFVVINTHLDAFDPALRLESTRQLLSWVDPKTPTIIVGDLNCGFDEAEIFNLLSFAKFCAVDLGCNTAPGFGQQRPGKQIDHIVTSHHWKHRHSRMVVPDTHPASDHLPVVAEFTLEETTATARLSNF